tara:strand:+ start:127 stop:339 length:213 start_codon:yes stop_codon:yes gene_type:complete
MSNDPMDAGAVEWEDIQFRMLEEMEIFYFENHMGQSNLALRKLDDNNALILKEQRVIQVNGNQKVWQKDY